MFPYKFQQLLIILCDNRMEVRQYCSFYFFMLYLSDCDDHKTFIWCHLFMAIWEYNSRLSYIMSSTSSSTDWNNVFFSGGFGVCNKIFQNSYHPLIPSTFALVPIHLLLVVTAQVCSRSRSITFSSLILSLLMDYVTELLTIMTYYSLQSHCSEQVWVYKSSMHTNTKKDW